MHRVGIKFVYAIISGQLTGVSPTEGRRRITVRGPAADRDGGDVGAVLDVVYGR